MNNIKARGRGDATRELLLVAALQVFGRDGYHAASTRAISDAAGTNQALIAYHFGGKEGLYLALFESIAKEMSAHMQPVLDSLQSRLEERAASSEQQRKTCVDGLEQLFTAMLDMFGQAQARNWVRMVMREQQDPTRAFDILYEGVLGKVLGVLTRLLAVASGQDPGTDASRLQALMLLGQVMVFVTARAAAARHMGWVEVGSDELAAVRGMVLARVRQTVEGGIST